MPLLLIAIASNLEEMCNSQGLQKSASSVCYRYQEEGRYQRLLALLLGARSYQEQRASLLGAKALLVFLSLSSGLLVMFPSRNVRSVHAVSEASLQQDLDFTCAMLAEDQDVEKRNKEQLFRRNKTCSLQRTHKHFSCFVFIRQNRLFVLVLFVIFDLKNLKKIQTKAPETVIGSLFEFLCLRACLNGEG